MTYKHPLIAFVGFARAGKDQAAKTLIERNYNRVCFGDIIKQQTDQLVQRHLGFSAFTEIDSEKKQIRGLFEQWGESNYQNIFNHFFATLPTPAVNTRLCRLREAYEWVNRGGIIVEVIRAGNSPETQWSADRVQELRDAGLIKLQIHNYGTVEELAETVRRELL